MIEKLITSNQDVLTMAIKSAKDLIKSKKIEEAILLLREYLEKNSNQSDILHLLADCYSKKGNWELAEKTYKKTLAYDSHHWIRSKWAWSLSMIGDIDAAKETYEALCQEHPEEPIYISFLAHTLNKIANYDEALNVLEKALTRFPDEAKLYLRLGETLALMNNFDSAIEAFLAASQQTPNEGYLKIKLAECYIQKNDWQTAKKYFLEHIHQYQDKEIIKRYCDTCLKFADTKSLEEMTDHDIAIFHLQKPFLPQNAKLLYSDLPRYNATYFSEIFAGFEQKFHKQSIGYADFKSKYVNHCDGVSVTTGQPEVYDSQVFILGNSVAKGYAVEDNHTIASILQGFCKTDPCQIFKVHNYGVGANSMDQIFLRFHQLSSSDNSSSPGDVFIIFHGRMGKKEHTENQITFYKTLSAYCKEKKLKFLVVIPPCINLISMPSPREQSMQPFALPHLTTAEIEETRYFMNEELEKNHIPFLDLIGIAHRPHKMGEVFVDAVHFNHRLNKVIAEKIYDALSNSNLSPETDYAFSLSDYKSKAIRSLSEVAKNKYQYNYDIVRWLKSVRNSRFNSMKKIGCIVMNCNPYTLGHDYLISKATEQVDGLYIFVVEEDLSDFPFVDRLRLVKEGVARFGDKVAIIPSGKFIISSFSFPGYFTKSTTIEDSDATTDVLIFASVIAKALNITHRFVGEEPTCQVTNNYNTCLAFFLPELGINFNVIERKREGNAAISASRVRQAMAEGDKEKIKLLVPKSTFNYLFEQRASQL